MLLGVLYRSVWFIDFGNWSYTYTYRLHTYPLNQDALTSWFLSIGSSMSIIWAWGFRSLAVLIFGFLSHGALFRAWGRIYLFIGSCAGALRDSF